MLRPLKGYMVKDKNPTLSENESVSLNDYTDIKTRVYKC